MCLLGTVGGHGSDWSSRESIVKVGDNGVREEERCGGNGRGRAIVAMERL